jgi:MFS family permease
VSSKSYVLLAILCAVNLLANSAYSSIAPFYPTEAISKGVPESLFGLVFSSYSIAMVIFSPMYARLLYKHGCRTVLTMGCISEGVAMVIFGTFHYIDHPATFACCSIFCRFLEGFGNGCLNSGSQKLVMKCFPESKLAKMTGILQTFTGLGMLCGPVLGSLLFAVGGFELPFYVAGILLLILSILVACVVPATIENKSISAAPGTSQAAEEADPTQEKEINEKLGFWSLLGRFRVLTCCMCVAMSLCCLTFIEPILALKLTYRYRISV